jgi:methylmalonyl-CoA mutase N-terminal domain/subunit
VGAGSPDPRDFRPGIEGAPYAEAPWIRGQYAGFSDPQETNARIRSLVAKGQTGVAYALDLPTQLGLDADHPAAEGEVGRVGVSLGSVDDLDAIVEGIALDSVNQFSSTSNSIGPQMIGLWLALAKRRGVAPTSFSVRLQNDVLKEYVARGTHVLPPDPAAELSVDAIEHCVRHLPTWVPISVSGYHMRDAGASREMELGFTLSLAREYLTRTVARGIEPAEIARRISWFFSASSQPFHEAAKFRAARELWARLLIEEFGVRDEAALGLRIIAYTLGGQMSPFEISNNSVRITLSALGAVLGRVQSLFCSSIDEALGLPSEENALLSIRTQEILLEEAGLGDLVDPLASATLIESLTDELVESATSWDRKVTDHGGMIAAIESGFIRDAIDENAWATELQGRERPRVGEDGDAAPDAELTLFVPDPSFEAARREQVAGWKAARSEQKVGAALSELKSAAKAGGNLVEPFSAAFLADVTLGESMEVLVGVHGPAKDRELLWR